MSNYNHLIGVKGEAWNQNGGIALAVPPVGIPNSIPFVIHAVREDNGQTWCEVQSGTLGLRIAPKICQNYPRLADCVVRAHQHYDEFPKYGSGIAGRLTLPPHPHPDAEDFFFSRLTTKNGVEIVLIDKAEGEVQLGGRVQIGMTRINPRSHSGGDTVLHGTLEPTPEQETLLNQLLENADGNSFVFAPSGRKGGFKEVRRNDPCPCGSGKKFKKCCKRQFE